MVSQSLVVTIEEARLDSQGVLRVSGWASGPAPVEAVEIQAAGVRIGEAEYGRPRPDVADDYPDFAGAGASGYRLAATLTEEVLDATEVAVVVRAGDGATRSAVAKIVRAEHVELRRPVDALHFECDSLTLYDDGSVEVFGWAVHPDEIAAIDVRLDGQRLGAATLGGNRPDVARSLPELASARRSGFEFREVVDNLAAGEHQVALEISTRRGEWFVRSLTAATQIARDKPPGAGREDIRLVIDSPQIADGALVEPVRRMLSIAGWAIARHGVAAVEAFLDGAPVGAASRGARRLDIGAAFPDWPEALTSGFALLLPRKMFAKERHTLRIVARDARGEVKEIELKVAVEPAERDDERTLLRTFAPQAEVDLKLSLIAASDLRPAFSVLLAPGQGELAHTLESLKAQVFPEFRVGLAAPTQAHAAEARAAAEAAALALTIFADDDDRDLASAAESLWRGDPGRELYVLRLRAGDRLGADALMEFALEIVTRPEEDFRYADDRRLDPSRGRIGAFLKPEWSPDLMLSMNYIGRTWCASLALVRRAGLGLADAFAAGDYDLALRLTEAAREIGRAPLILAETEPASDDPPAEKAALRAAMARRGIKGGVRDTDAPGVYRLRRRLGGRGLVSIVIPTIASGGLIEKCLDSLRRRTLYNRIEIVCVDNIQDPNSSWKDWLKREADCVVEYPAPFNWSRLNNLGAEAALGDYLLFLNDDIEAVEPRWLHAMLEHAARAEVGVVAPRLLYPDGRVQHAGMFLAARDGRHAFRFAPSDAVGAFGLAAAQRNVAAVTGAAMLMRRAAFEEIGGFDEGHAIVNNDVDLCLRMWRAGLRVVYTPHASLIHHEMASRAELDDVFDESGFDRAWRNTFALGDPFFHPRLSRDDNDYAPDPEPARDIVAGRPLIARADVRRILVQKLDHVGDFITGLPAIQRLKHRFPAAEVHLLAPAASVALARVEPAIDNVIEFNFFHFVSQQGRLEIGDDDWAALEARLKPYRFDIAIDLRKHMETRDILRHSGARLTAGFDHRGLYSWLDVALEWDGDQPYLGKRAQVAEDYVALVEAVSLACESERAFLAGPPAEQALAILRALPALGDLRPGLFDRPIVGVHAGAGNALRQWPPAHFAGLIDLIVDAFEVNVALIGATGEANITEAVLAETRATDRVWSLVGLTELAELPTLLRALRLFVGNNSGPHHIAAALGTPTVGVHSGVVSVREWGPLGPMAVAVQREMSCGPCYLDRPSRCSRGMACLTGLRPAEVFRVCEQMLGAALRRP